MKGLKQTVIGGLVALLLSLPFSSNAQKRMKHYDSWDAIKTTDVSKMALDDGERFVINPFKQPNDSTLAYYGSGDANNDGKTDWMDVLFMQTLDTHNDRSDVNGDEKQTNADLILLEDYLNDKTPLPGHWNELKTREERESWLEKMLAIDKIDTLPFIPGERECRDFSFQMIFNFYGFIDDPAVPYLISENGLNPEHNGRFNLPVYSVVVNPSFGFPTGAAGHIIEGGA